MRRFMRRLTCLMACSAALGPARAIAGTSLAAGTSPDVPWLRIILSFALCILLAVGAIFALRAYHARGRNGGGLAALFQAKDIAQQSHISILEMRRIGPNADLCVVRFGDEHLLLSVARDGANVIARRHGNDTAAEPAGEGRAS